MPHLSPQYKVAMGIGATELSYDGTAIQWTSHPFYPELVGRPIIGDGIAWLNSWTLVFQSCQTPTSPSVTAACRLYTYDIRTTAISLVSNSGATIIRAGGGVWAAWLEGVGYRDSLGRTSADYGLVDVDDDGTVVVILNNTDKTGLGYLLSSDDDASDVRVITADRLETAWSFGGGVVMYHANGVLVKYDINTDTATTTNVPVQIYANYGSWILARHLRGLGAVAFEFGKTVAHQVSTSESNFNGDIRVAVDNTIHIATSNTVRELPTSTRKHTLTQSEPLFDLFVDTSTNIRTVPGIGPTGDIVTVVGSDVITLGDPAYRNETGLYASRGVGQVVSSADWFGSHGQYIRGAWQWDITAVVAQTDATGNTNVTVKDSFGNTWAANEPAYGSRAVAIRPAPTTTNVAPTWEVTWVQSGGGSYRRAILDVDLALVGSITTTTAGCGTEGFLDLYSNGVPIITSSHAEEWYGYVKLRYATTRGDWTIGKDVSPTCSINRIVAWNNATSYAYVVWNGDVQDQSRLTLEYNFANTATPVVVPSNRNFVIRDSQFVLLGQIDVELGQTSGTSQTTPTGSSPNQPGAPANWPWSYDLPVPATVAANTTPSVLKSNTRVFRRYQTIPPTAKVLAAIKLTKSST